MRFVKKEEKIADELIKAYDTCLIICSDYDEESERASRFIKAKGRKRILAQLILDFIAEEDDLQSIMIDLLEKKMNE